MKSSGCCGFNDSKSGDMMSNIAYFSDIEVKDGILECKFLNELICFYFANDQKAEIFTEVLKQKVAKLSGTGDIENAKM